MTKLTLTVFCLLLTLAAALGATSAAVGAQSDTAAAPPAHDRRTPIVRAVERCGPSVVNISTKRVERDPFFFGMPDVFLRNLPPGMVQREAQSLGSGVLVHRDGYIVTNAHVVQQATEIEVALADKRTLPATLVSVDPDNDLAIIKVDAREPLPAAQLGTSSDLMIGETVIAIGNPLGYRSTVSAGIISAVDRKLDFAGGISYDGLIQTDAAINPGNSGGALLNINGEVIGINVAIRADAEGLGFAIPVDRVRDNLEKLLNFRNLKRLWLGVSLHEERRKDDAGQWTFTLRVTEVEKDSPAEKAGLAAGDQIAGIGDRPVTSMVDFETVLIERAVGDVVDFKVVRESKTRRVKVTLGQAPKPDGAKLAENRLGLHLEPVTADAVKEFGLAVSFGMLVTGVEADSSAAEAGFRAGDVVVQAGTHRLDSLDDLGLVLVTLDQDTKIVLRVVRGRYVVRVAVPVRGKPDIRH